MLGKRLHGRILAVAILATSAAQLSAIAGGKSHHKPDPLIFDEMGSFAFGGTIISNDAGQTLRCDHGYTQYQVPKNAREVPLTLWHSSSVRTWETTPDGREGFQNIFLRRGWSVYTPDPPRLGRAAQGCVSLTYTPAFMGQAGPTGPQTPTTPEWIDQFSRFRYPENPEVNQVPPGLEGDPIETPAMVDLINKIGPTVLMTHSGSGSRGFLAASKSKNVKGVISYEPIAFPFPSDDPPGPITSVLTGHLANITRPVLIPPAEFKNLTRVKIQVVFGELSLQNDVFKTVIQRAEQFAQALNDRGGDVEILRLADIGIKGNAHFLMLEKNNVQLADIASKWLKRKRLDGASRKH